MASSARGPPGVTPKMAVPNQTLYCRNLPDKMRKIDLKRQLYMLFITYGVVLDVVVLKSSKMRGQAHIVFRDIDSSTQAMRHLQNFEFFGNKLQIHYARGKSDAVKKLDGTFKMDIPHKPVEEQTAAQTAAFGSAPAPLKAKPINAPPEKGLKRARDEESEEEDEDEEAAMDVSDSD